MALENIRNFCIIAHVDHGKSTLADRFLEITGTVEKRRMKEQYLDQLELERERGITIKMAPVRMTYILNATSYTLNLIDTPGHTDFSYEVSRALAAVEGAILLVDATQGIQAQTLAVFNAAKKSGLTVIGAVNKIDLKSDSLGEVIKSVAELLGVPEEEIFKVSGKTGEGVEDLLKAVIEQMPSPTEAKKIFQALIFDSFYHEHKGIVAAARVFSGNLNSGDDAYLIATNTAFKVKELGHFSPELKSDAKLESGQIGYIATGLKNPDLLKIGDTIINADLRRFFTRINADNIRENPRFDPRESASLALPGYQEPQPVVFVSFYPDDNDDYENLKNDLEKLKLNDSALKFEPDFNEFLGRGFKTGFLGRLHFEITAERLEKEFHIKTVHSFPSVSYKVKTAGNKWIFVNNPKDFPADYSEAMEPVAKLEIIAPEQYMGAVIQLQRNFRLKNIETKNFGNKSILISAELPLVDLISNFDDQLKSVSAGYASLSYEISGFQKTEAAKLEILVAGQIVSGLTRIVHKGDLEREARKTVERLKDLLPRQQFLQAIQAMSGGRIIARENIPAMKKLLGNFGKTGGDRTRKMKLWKKQKRGKGKLKELASKTKIHIPANVFKELLNK